MRPERNYQEPEFKKGDSRRRLFNYSEYADRMSPLEYAGKVIAGELKDPVLSFELDNGFRFIKILPNYLDDVRSLNYASFIEWLNPKA